MKRTGPLLTSLLLLVAAAPGWGASVELKSGRFCLVLGDAGKPLSLRRLPGGEEVLNQQWLSAGFYLQDPNGKRTLLNNITSVAGGRFVARSADGKEIAVAKELTHLAGKLKT